jgi:hypothetical protein
LTQINREAKNETAILVGTEKISRMADFIKNTKTGKRELKKARMFLKKDIREKLDKKNDFC